MSTTIILIIIIAIIWLSISAYNKKKQEEAKKAALQKRREHLLKKYGSPEIADKIMNGVVWIDQTEEQLLDSRGHPADVDSKVLKTKTKEIWKYHPKGKGRFGLRITVENGYVVGWDDKR